MRRSITRKKYRLCRLRHARSNAVFPAKRGLAIGAVVAGGLVAGLAAALAAGAARWNIETGRNVAWLRAVHETEAPPFSRGDLVGLPDPVVRFSNSRSPGSAGRAQRAISAGRRVRDAVGHFSDYRRIDGMMIPMWAEVEWLLPEGPSPYFRGRILDAQYDFAAMNR